MKILMTSILLATAMIYGCNTSDTDSGALGGSELQAVRIVLPTTLNVTGLKAVVEIRSSADGSGANLSDYETVELATTARDLNTITLEYKNPVAYSLRLAFVENSTSIDSATFDFTTAVKYTNVDCEGNNFSQTSSSPVATYPNSIVFRDVLICDPERQVVVSDTGDDAIDGRQNVEAKVKQIVSVNTHEFKDRSAEVESKITFTQIAEANGGQGNIIYLTARPEPGIAGSPDTAEARNHLVAYYADTLILTEAVDCTNRPAGSTFSVSFDWVHKRSLSSWEPKFERTVLLENPPAEDGAPPSQPSYLQEPLSGDYIMIFMKDNEEVQCFPISINNNI